MNGKQEQLKLFVWEGVLRDYTSGVIFALAKDEDEARCIVMETHGELAWRETASKPKVCDSPVAFALWGGG
jgi:hypothetical protein